MAKRVADLHPMEIEVSIHGAQSGDARRAHPDQGLVRKDDAGPPQHARSGDHGPSQVPDHEAQSERAVSKSAIWPTISDSDMIFDAVITPKDDGNLDPLALRPDEDFLQKYWGEWYLDLHHGRLPPRTNHCAADGAEANCGTGRSGFTIDPYGNILPCVAFRRPVANILEIDSWAPSGRRRRCSMRSGSGDQCAPEAERSGKRPVLPVLSRGGRKAGGRPAGDLPAGRHQRRKR